MTQKKKLAAATRLLHTDYPSRDAYRSLSMPVYHAAAYEFDDAAQMEEAFTGRSADFAYSRLANPTVAHFENEVKAVTGAHDVMAFNSGMAAIADTFLALAYAGSNIVTSPHIFGNTYSLFRSTLSDFGVAARLCDMNDPAAVEAAVDDDTVAVFLEAITNPQLEVADLRVLSAICRRRGVPLVVDTTVIPFTVFRASECGVDIEVVSSTKYVSGGATSLGGLVIDYASFDCSRSKRLAPLAKQFGNGAFAAKMRREIMRNLGAYMTPHVAYMQTLGLETMQVRYERAASSCLALARRLRTLPGIVRVNYTGLEENPYHELSRSLFGETAGAMMTVDLASREACFRMIDRLRLIRRATNLFDNKSLAIHPASTIFGTFSEEERRKMDVSQLTVRLSIGLEDPDDLFEDICQALDE